MDIFAFMFVAGGLSPGSPEAGDKTSELEAALHRVDPDSHFSNAHLCRVEMAVLACSPCRYMQGKQHASRLPKS